MAIRIDRWRERRRSATAIERTFGGEVARRPPRLIVAGQKIREIRDFYRFVYRELPEILDRYEKWRAGQYRERGA
ncbi:hypothetical protein ATK36_5033 [Amycolatopsis sulphurea]|uniref:Uncharacterized protein n=1 Tax=Amycolatopsis sulphurea TaxID=76022 RepID=A0A2A9FGF2_9PSEU|nr:hypothetical protein [Amycolatopsis sulphurea]PFG49846.1 hypothetical protein ATK36_5033 [Amycolatopsis sulphurea]